MKIRNIYSYSASISLFSSFSGTARIYRTLLHLQIKKQSNNEPDQNIAEMSSTLSINQFITSSKLGMTAIQFALPEDSCKHHMKPNTLQFIPIPNPKPRYSNPHFSLIQTSFPVISFKKGFGFTNSLIYEVIQFYRVQSYNTAAHRMIVYRF